MFPASKPITNLNGVLISYMPQYAVIYCNLVRAIPFSKSHREGGGPELFWEVPTSVIQNVWLPPPPAHNILNSILHLQPPCTNPSSHISNYLIPPTWELHVSPLVRLWKWNSCSLITTNTLLYWGNAGENGLTTSSNSKYILNSLMSWESHTCVDILLFNTVHHERCIFHAHVWKCPLLRSKVLYPAPHPLNGDSWV